MKAFLFLFSILAFTGMVYAHDDYSELSNDNNLFRQGYSAGYEHGMSDSRSRVSFNFRHDDQYKAGGSYNQSNGSYNYGTDNRVEFRLGYVEGYSDGFFRKTPIVTSIGGHHDGEYGDVDRNIAPVTLFTDTGFRGSVRNVDVGRYPVLEGGWNDSIESLRINGNVRVILFDQSNFRGERIVIEGRSAYDLAGFRGKAASMIIEPIGFAAFR